VKTFKQITSTRKVYHADLGADGLHPATVKPSWSIASTRGGEPSHDLAAIEVSSDGLSARISTHQWDGKMTVTVSTVVERTAISDSFEINVLPAPAELPQFRFGQFRDRPI
jgi:hypothetical protein